MNSILALESFQVWTSGYYHAYLVYSNDNGVTWEVVEGDPTWEFNLPIYGNIEARHSVGFVREINSNPYSLTDGGHTVIATGSEATSAWELIKQQATDTDAANIEYILLGQNSNSVVASSLHAVGYNINDYLPLTVFGQSVDALDLVGSQNLLSFGRSLFGSDADDRIVGYAQDDILFGGAGDDTIKGDDGATDKLRIDGKLIDAAELVADANGVYDMLGYDVTYDAIEGELTIEDGANRIKLEDWQDGDYGRGAANDNQAPAAHYKTAAYNS